MALHMDPSGAELRALAGAADWHDKRVIEVGCGDGRLTLRMASLGPASIEALDPDSDSIRAARQSLPKEHEQRIRYHIGQAHSLQYPPGTFGIALFSWVL